jgi:predicted transcriptional regulator
MAAGQLWIEKNEVFSRFLRGLCVLSDKAITISDSERSQIIPLSEIGAVTIESNYKLQIYNEILETLYQITFDNDSALKWQDIIDNILTYQYNKQITTR